MRSQNSDSVHKETRLEILSRPKAPKILQKLLGDSEELKRFQRIPTDSKRIQKIPTASKRFQKISKDSKRFQKNPKDTNGYKNIQRTYGQRIFSL